MILYLIQWALVVLGVVYFVTDSVIFAPARIFVCRGSLFRTTLVYCPACMGFWVGLVFGFLTPQLWDNVVQSGFAGMALGRIWAEFCPGKMYQFELSQLGFKPDEDSHDTETEAKNV